MNKTSAGQMIYSERLTPEFVLKLFESSNAKRIFLVHGKKSYELSGAKSVFDKAISNCILKCEFTEFSENPKWEDIQNGIKLAKEFIPDLIIGVGGGSALDVAKTIRFFYSYSGKPSVRDYERKKNLIPLIAIPTTAGSGAESTHFAVVYENGIKQSLNHNDVLPETVVLDWLLTVSNSDYTTACTGMDALCHSIESYWACSSTDESRKLAKQAMKIIFPILNKRELYKTDGFREKMILGANLAGQAINISTTTVCHAFSYKITSLLGLSHGHAAAVSLPYFFNLNMNVTDENCNDKRGVEFVKERLAEICEILGFESGNEYELLSDYVKSVFSGLRDVAKPTDEQWKEIVGSVNAERLENNPVKILRLCDSVSVYS